MHEKAEPSVWYVATIAICVFAGLMMIMGGFSGQEAGIAIAAQN